MAKSKPILARLSDLTSGQYADFFALLSERSKGATRENKPFYTCRFRDARRTATLMVWADSPTFAACESVWQPGLCYKIRGTYGEHERYGPQIEVERIRAVNDADELEVVDPSGPLVGEGRFDERGQARPQPAARIVRRALDRGDHGRQHGLDMAVVDGAQQLLAALELLVEVPRVESCLSAQRLDRRRRISGRPEQLKAGVEQLLAPLGSALSRRLTAVDASAAHSWSGYDLEQSGKSA